MGLTQTLHYTFSPWESWHLKSLAIQLLIQQLIQASNKEIIKCSHHRLSVRGIHQSPLDSPHHDVIKWKHFPLYWPFVRGIHRSPVNSPHKGQWHRALRFSLICALNKRMSKQSWGWWFEMASCSLWRHCNDKGPVMLQVFPCNGIIVPTLREISLHH